jgi:hypothetical protein
MKVDKNNSWKEKIGPAFDGLIKAYLYYIKLSYFKVDRALFIPLILGVSIRILKV